MAMKELGFETKLKEGLKQGDALSCLLFNLALEIVMRHAGTSTSRILVDGLVQDLDFADDLDLADHQALVRSYPNGFAYQRIKDRVHEDLCKHCSRPN